MDRRQLLGLSGSLLVFVGIFMPIVSIPIAGSQNLFQNGRGDGVFLLALAALGAGTALTKRYRWCLISGIGTLVYLVWFVLTFQNRILTQESLNETENPFRSLGDALLHSAQIQWGWAILVVGGLLLASAGAPPKPWDLTFVKSGRWKVHLSTLITLIAVSVLTNRYVDVSPSVFPAALLALIASYVLITRFTKANLWWLVPPAALLALILALILVAAVFGAMF